MRIIDYSKLCIQTFEHWLRTKFVITQCYQRNKTLIIKVLLFHESYQKRHDLICGFSSFLLSFSIYCLQCSSRFFLWIALYILTIQNNKQDTQHIERHFLGCIRSSFRYQSFILFLSQLKMFLAFVTFNFSKNKLFSIQ